MNSKKINIEIIGIFSIIVGFLFFNRLIIGADTTDESFYVVMAYRLVQGNVLFADMWEQVSTSSVISAILLWIYKSISGGVEGCILFLRLAFFIINSFAAILLYKAESKIVKKEYAVLLTLFYLTYAPFHIYIFGYNNLADMFFLITVSFYMIGYIEGKEKYFIFAGIFCAILAFTYPTMIIMCLTMFVLILIRRKEYGIKCWLCFCFGGLGIAFVISVILFMTVGVRGVLGGIRGILSDPAYSISEIEWSEKLQKAVEYFFYPLTKDGVFIKFYTVWLFILSFWEDRYKWLKLTVALYPVVVLLEIWPLGITGTYGMGNYVFFISFMAPWLIGFVDKHRKVALNLLYIQWIPSVFFYLIVGSSSYGGAGQGSQCLFLAAIVTLTEIILIIQETFDSLNKEKVKYGSIATILILCLTIIIELQIYYSVVYRDGDWKSLENVVTVGPYKGIRTTIPKKEYLEDMYYVMQNMEEKDRTACVLYHSNFAYLYLDMIPVTPTAWGLYPHLDNQDVFLKYFSESDEHIPEFIYVVDVDDAVDFDSQDEQYYGFAGRLDTFISWNYSLSDVQYVRNTGKVKKYTLVNDSASARQSIEKIRVYTVYGDGFYELESTKTDCWTWATDKASFIIKNDNNHVIKANINMDVYTGNEEKSKFSISDGNEIIDFTIDKNSKRIEFEAELLPGDNKFEFTTDAKRYVVEDDSRILYFCIKNLAIDLHE